MPKPKQLIKPRPQGSLRFPVQFDEFKRLVENLPDIAYDLKIDGVAATLEECARWYYEQFYTKPSIREKYAFKLRPCSSTLKENLLQIPQMQKDPAGDMPDKPESQREAGIKILLEGGGCFNFPVTFRFFEKYLDKEKVARILIKEEGARQETLANAGKCEAWMKKLYNTFYIFPHRRRDLRVYFNEAVEALPRILLRYGWPLDKHAREIVAKDSEKESQRLVEASVVRFEVFQEHILNLHEISSELRDRDPQGATRNLEHYSQSFYFAFYLHPKIRRQYCVRIKDCAPKMKQRLLSIPCGMAAKLLRQLMPPALRELPPYNCSTSTRLPRTKPALSNIQEETYEGIRESEIESKDMQRDEGQLNQRTSQGHFSGSPTKDAVEMVESEEVVLVCDTDSEKDQGICEEPATAKIDVLEIQNAQEDLEGNTLEKKEETVKERNNNRVSYSLFKRFLRNLDDIVLQMQKSKQYEKLSPKECAKAFYRGFYANPEFRKRFECKWKPCPSKVREQLLSYPVDQCESTAETEYSRNTAPVSGMDTDTASGDIPIEISECENDQVECVSPEKGTREKPPLTLSDSNKKVPIYPVTFKVFKKHVSNLDDIIQQMQQCEQYKNLSFNECIREYYKSFYSKPETRKKFVCKWKACPSKVQRQLLSYSATEESSSQSAKKMKSHIESPTENPSNTETKGKEVGHSKESKNRHIKGLEKRDAKATTDRYPLTFEAFKKYITNLKNIVLQMQQCQQYKDKSSGECEWEYYKGFYSEKEFRKMFVCELRPCPARVREKLLSFPEKPNKDPSPECAMENEVTVAIDSPSEQFPRNAPNELVIQTESSTGNDETPKIHTTIINESECPTLADQKICDSKESSIQPVSFHIFKRYIANIDDITQQMKQCAEYKDISERQCAQLFFKGFYADPSIRKKFNYSLRPCPRNIREKLLSYPAVGEDPNDNPKIHTTIINQSECTTLADQKICDSKESSIEPVSFHIFKRYIANIDDITQQMKQCAEYKDISERQCAQLFFKGFYADPSIRKKFNYSLRPCPRKIREKLLSYLADGEDPNDCNMDTSPAPDQVDTKTQETPPNKNNPLTKCVKGILYEFPVTLETFKKFINFAEIKEQLLRSGKNITNLPENLLMAKLYSSFYVKATRNRLPCKINFVGASADLQEKLIAYAIKKKPPESPEGAEVPPTSSPVNATAKEPTEKPASNSDFDCIYSCEESGSFLMPVNFETFHRCINFDELLESVLLAEFQNRDQVEAVFSNLLLYEKECSKLYRSFYISENFRRQLSFRFIAEGELLKKLQEYAKPLDEKAKNSIVLRRTQGKEQSHVTKETDDTLISIDGVLYKFPVSLKTFRRYINYEELIVLLVQDSTASANSEKMSEILANTRNCMRLLRRFYHSFYVTSNIRERFKYSFPSAPAEVLEELMAFAVPVSLADKNCQQLPKELLTTCNGQSETEPPVSYKQFSSIIILEEVVKRMKAEPQYANMSEDECKHTFYKSFYNSPSIRLKYSYQMRACSQQLKTMILTIPEPTPQKPLGTPKPKNLQELHAARKQELTRKKKCKVFNYPKSREYAIIEQLSIEINSHEAPGNKTSVHSASHSIKDATSTAKTVEHSSCHSKQASMEAPVQDSNKVNCDQASSQSVAVDPTVQAKIVKSSDKPKGNPKSQSTADDPTEQTKTVENSDKPKENSKSKEVSETEKKAEDAANTSLERQAQLEEAKEIFFAESSREHNLKYLICTSWGLKRTIWRILYQLSQEEFKTYTSIHDGEDLYKNELSLKHCHQHVVDQGNWPLNLYVRLPKLRQLLQSKGVLLDEFHLGQLSPKMLHWRDLMLHTDFDDIVEIENGNRSDKECESIEILSQVRINTYEACWRCDQWIYAVPKITNSEIFGALTEDMSIPNKIALKPLCPSKCISQAVEISSSPETVAQVPDSVVSLSSDTANESHNCSEIVLPTQMDTLNFIDVAEVYLTQPPADDAIDPLRPIKGEPVKFLSNLRGECDSNGCAWETIASEEQIYNLDDSHEGAASFSCFAIAKPSVEPLPVPEKSMANTMLLEENMEDVVPCAAQQNESQNLVPETTMAATNLLKESVEVPSDPQPTESLNLGIIEPQVASGSRKKRHPSADKVPAKRPRLVNDKVPQLRHEFRPLPLQAMVRVESGGLSNPKTNAPEDDRGSQPTECGITASQECGITASQECGITASQDFALGNTLLESSQMQRLLESSNVTLRKVIPEEPNNNIQKVTTRGQELVSSAPLWSNVIFRRLERFQFIQSLTVEEIIKYQIEGHLAGATYEEALIKIDDGACKVRGSLLDTLFPHLTPSLLTDVRHVIRDLGHFAFNCRVPVYKDPMVDIRTRVLFLFIESAPKFGQFALHFDNATKEWATCSKVPGQGERKTDASIVDIIKPDILAEMRELKEMGAL